MFSLLSFLRLWMQVLVLLSLIYASKATLVNVTVDDTLGDSQSGRKPIYSGTWFSSLNCSSASVSPLCGLDFDTSSLLNGTWSGSTSASSSFSIIFNGTAVYAFFVIPSDIFTTDFDVFIDDNFRDLTSGSFRNVTDPIRFHYNTSLVSISNLSDGQHNLTIVVGGKGSNLSHPKRSAFGAIFDYALYTTKFALFRPQIASEFHSITQSSTVNRDQSLSTKTTQRVHPSGSGKVQLITEASVPSPSSTSNSDQADGSLPPKSTLTDSPILQSSQAPEVNHAQSSTDSFGSSLHAPSALTDPIVSSDPSSLTAAFDAEPTDPAANTGETQLPPGLKHSTTDGGSPDPSLVPETQTPGTTKVLNPTQSTETANIPGAGSPGTGKTGSPPVDPTQTISSSPIPQPTSPPISHNKPELAGIVAGVVIGCLILLLLLLLLCIRRSDRFVRFLPRRLARARSLDTIHSFVTREFPPLPSEAPRKRLYLVQAQTRRSTSIENLIPPRIDISAKGTRYNLADPARERLLSRGSPEHRPNLPSPVRFRPLTLFASATTISSVSDIDFRQNSHLETDYLRRISALETEVQRLQSERDYLAHLTYAEELPDYSDLNSPRNSPRNSA